MFVLINNPSIYWTLNTRRQILLKWYWPLYNGYSRTPQMPTKLSKTNFWVYPHTWIIPKRLCNNVLCTSKNLKHLLFSHYLFASSMSPSYKSASLVSNFCLISLDYTQRQHLFPWKLTLSMHVSTTNVHGCFPNKSMPGCWQKKVIKFISTT